MRTQKQRQVAVLLHDIRSVHNIGSIFRTADALGVSQIYLSGFSPLPVDRFGRHRKDVAKVALGAEKSVPWQAVSSPTRLIKEMRAAGYQVISLEQSERSVDYKRVAAEEKILFIVGNEVSGVPKNILNLSTVVVEIPMLGTKESLNVSVAFGIGLFRILGL